MPHCQRCIKAKRPCHYGDVEIDDHPVKFIFYATTKQPTLFPGLTQAERRSLHHFQHRTAEELPSPFRSDLWSNVIMQAAQHHPAVRHAIFALSAMHEHYAAVQASQVQYDFSMHHYNKAIRQVLRTTEPSDSFDSLLLTSVMFCALEGLKGEFDQSQQHALSGIRIIAMGRQGLSGASSAIPNDVLPKIFLALQTQAMELNDHSIFRDYPNLEEKFPPLPRRFEHFEQAMCYLQIILNQLIVFQDRFQEAYQQLTYVPAIVPDHLLPGFRALRDYFHRWNEAVGQIETLATRADANQHKAYFLIRIYQSVLHIVLDSLDKNILSFDSFEPEVRSMLKLIEIFLQVPSSWTTLPSSDIGGAISTSRVYSMSLGVVPILFDIAHRSRNLQMREEALNLLRSCNRREGIWDSKAATRLAERHNTLQEEVDASCACQDPYHRVIITDIGLLTDGEIPFQYMIVPAESMMESFWFSSFNPPPDMPAFKCQA